MAALRASGPLLSPSFVRFERGIIPRSKQLPSTRSSSSSTTAKIRTKLGPIVMAASSTPAVVEERLGIRIERNPSEERLTELGVRKWPTWSCGVSEFPWTYEGTETCYLLRGKVQVTPAGSSEFVEFGAGDLVVFPDGMSCEWRVAEAVHKHYRFD